MRRINRTSPYPVVADPAIAVEAEFDRENAAELDRLREERKREGWTVATCEIRTNSPHPRAYGAAMKLPLTTNRFTEAELLRITPAERKALAARPLKVCKMVSPADLLASVLKDHNVGTRTVWNAGQVDRYSVAFHARALRIDAEYSELLSKRDVMLSHAPATVASDVASAPDVVVLTPLKHDAPKRVQCMRCNDSKRMRVRFTGKDGETYEQYHDCDACTAPRKIGKGVTVVTTVDVPKVEKVAKTKRATVAPIAPAKQSKSDKDALRRAFIAWLKGRAVMSKDGKRYMVKHARTGKTSPAPWSAVVESTFSDVQEFHRAAHAWQSPRNAATLAKH